MAINTATSGKPKAVSGAIYVAPVGTALPTDATTSLNASFKSVGYISDEGITNAYSISSEETKSWGGLVVMSTITEKVDDFKFKMISAFNTEALKVVYGDSNVTVESTGAIKISAGVEEPTAHSYVIEMIMAGVATRVVIPNGKLKELEDIVYNDTDPTGYGVTISAMADSNDKTHYTYANTPKES